MHTTLLHHYKIVLARYRIHSVPEMPYWNLTTDKTELFFSDVEDCLLPQVNVINFKQKFSNCYVTNMSWS